MRHRQNTLEELYLFGSNELKNNQISNNKKETEWIILHILNKTSSWFHSNKNYILEQSKLNYFIDCIDKRKDHIPLQLILGTATFYGRDFILFPDVFIPRPETEQMIDILSDTYYNSALDICSGSGVLAITLYLEGIVSSADAIEISEISLDNISENIKYFNCSHSVQTYQLDILKQIPDKQYDLIVCNPPYIKLNDIQFLPHNVQHYDPINALTDFGNGLSFYFRIKEIIPHLLSDHGMLLLEFGGSQQLKSLQSIFSTYNTTILNDYNNTPRIMKIQS